jgi:hypothetical protein
MRAIEGQGVDRRLAIEVHHQIVAQDGQVDGLTHVADEALQIGTHRLDETGTAAERVGEDDDLPAELVDTVIFALLDVTARRQTRQKTMRRALRETEPEGDVFEAETLLGLTEEVEHVQGFGHGEIGADHSTLVMELEFQFHFILAIVSRLSRGCRLSLAGNDGGPGFGCHSEAGVVRRQRGVLVTSGGATVSLLDRVVRFAERGVALCFEFPEFELGDVRRPLLFCHVFEVRGHPGDD